MAVDWQERMKKTCQLCRFSRAWCCHCGRSHSRECHYDDRIKRKNGQTRWPEVSACCSCEKFQPRSQIVERLYDEAPKHDGRKESGLNQEWVNCRIRRVRRIARAAIEHANTGGSESACACDEVIQRELSAEACEEKEACAEYLEKRGKEWKEGGLAQSMSPEQAATATAMGINLLNRAKDIRAGRHRVQKEGEEKP